jgi:hypothetical protein
MDQEYKEIFSALYYSGFPLGYPARWARWGFEEPWFLSEDSGAIRRAIDEAEQQLLLDSRQRLRPDAKHFLLSNLMGMVVAPVRMRGEVDFKELAPMLRDDVALLVRAASRRQETLAPGEISSHAVLEAVATNWKKLKLSGLRIWGED